MTDNIIYIAMMNDQIITDTDFIFNCKILMTVKFHHFNVINSGTCKLF